MDYQAFHSDFCPICGGLIELETISETIMCQICSTQLSFKQFAGKVIKTELPIRKDKQWLHKYEVGRRLRERKGKSKMIIAQRCPKCDNPEMKYYVVQTRSVDEGSTVFYECQKCNHTYSLNN